MKRTKKATKSLTFKEWKAKGYHVIKGQKASGRNDNGEAVFSEKQVEVTYNEHNSDYDEDDYNQWYDTYGHTRDWA